MPARGSAASGGGVVQQRVLQRAGAIARSRMHDESRGLVDDEQRVILVHDRERDRFGRRHVVDRVRNDGDDDALAAADLLRRERNLSVDHHLAGVDPRPQAAARIPGQRLRQRRVEARADRIVGKRQRDRVGAARRVEESALGVVRGLRGTSGEGAGRL